jgi:hypothetical protein
MFSQIQQTFRNVPDLILTPFFTTGSTWPSYHIKPVYNDIEAPPVVASGSSTMDANDDVNKSSEVNDMAQNQYQQQLYYQNYMNTAGNIALNVGMQPHTCHTNQMGQQYMYPTMPYYIPATKVGERVPPVMYPPQSVYNQYPQTGVAV